MSSIQKIRNILFRMIEDCDLDFFLQPWTLSYGIIIEKGVRFVIRKSDDGPGDLFPSRTVVEYWNWIVIFTSRGREKLKIPAVVCDCVEEGKYLPIEVQKSFLFPKRVRLRLAPEKKTRQPV